MTLKVILHELTCIGTHYFKSDLNAMKENFTSCRINILYKYFARRAVITAVIIVKSAMQFFCSKQKYEHGSTQCRMTQLL